MELDYLRLSLYYLYSHFQTSYKRVLSQSKLEIYMNFNLKAFTMKFYTEDMNSYEILINSITKYDEIKMQLLTKLKVDQSCSDLFEFYELIETNVVTERFLQGDVFIFDTISKWFLIQSAVSQKKIMFKLLINPRITQQSQFKLDTSKFEIAELIHNLYFQRIYIKTDDFCQMISLLLSYQNHSQKI